jgi:predicted nucleic acid-binding protein
MVAAYYLDTSALVKQYVDEVGSAWIRDQIASEAVVLIISQVLTVEMISAFNRRLREGSVTPDDYARMVTLFDNDLQTRYQIVRFDNPIVALARVLLEHHPLRAYDAVHLSSALVMHRTLVQAGQPGLTFLCADDRLLDAAEAEGLMVDNPNRHEQPVG